MKINCDMGESFGIWTMGQDETIMPYLDMANIACGMHASDPLVMQKTVSLAIQHGVLIGAHPAYPDLQGFGRRAMQMPATELQAYLIYQMGALEGICKSSGAKLSYVKPHGALYNTMMKDDETLIAILKAIQAYDPQLTLVIMAVPDFEKYQVLANEHGIKLWFEAFVDRAYGDDGRLVPRHIEGSSYHHIDEVAAQAKQMIEENIVTTLSGKILPIKADTLCIHGDNHLSVLTAETLRGHLAR